MIPRDQYAALVFTVGKMEGGFARSLPQRFGFVPSVGAVVMLSVTPTLLSPYYRGRLIPGFGIFLNLRPPAHSMAVSSLK